LLLAAPTEPGESPPGADRGVPLRRPRLSAHSDRAGAKSWEPSEGRPLGRRAALAGVSLPRRLTQSARRRQAEFTSSDLGPPRACRRA